MYITNDKPNVAGLVLSGSADFKTELSQSDMFDPRLQAVVLGVLDVSYGEGGGFDCVAGASQSFKGVGSWDGIGCSSQRFGQVVVVAVLCRFILVLRHGAEYQIRCPSMAD